VIIHPMKTEVTALGVRVSAPIQYAADAVPSAELWYEFTGVSENAISEGMDGFVAALVLVAMQHGPVLEVRGGISARARRGILEYQRVFHAWFPDTFSPVEIRSVGPSLATGGRRPTAVAAAFSGGIDSSYTLMTHLPEREPDKSWQISHAIFVHGFDIPLSAEEVFSEAATKYRQSLSALGVQLITVRTNIREFVNHPSWNITHGSALASVALLLDRLLGRFYIPASFQYTDLGPWGSHPLVDPMLSSSTLEIIHDGAAARVDKVMQVAEWPEARQWLRVCWERPNASRNCGQCYNCLLTMVSLEIGGRLSQCPTFPAVLDRAALRGVQLPESEFPEVAALIARARDTSRNDLVSDLEALLRGSRRALAAERRWAGVRRMLKSLRGLRRHVSNGSR